MSIAWRDGAAADNSSSGSSTLSITVPSTVQAGDAVLIYFLSAAGDGSSYVTVSVATTGTTTPAQMGSSIIGASGSLGQMWWFTAASGDASAVITFTVNQGSYLGAVLGAYSGASSSQPDVIATGNQTTAGTTFPAPTATTAKSGDWAIYTASTVGGNTLSSEPGTLREATSSAVRAALADSNASVGGSGTSIGGGDWTAGSSTPWLGFTIGLAEAGAAPSASPGAFFQFF